MTCTLEDSTDNENVVQMESAISFLVCVCVCGGGGGVVGRGGRIVCLDRPNTLFTG